MSRIHNPPDFDEPPPPSYAESQNTANNPAFVPNPEQFCNQGTPTTTTATATTTGPPQPSSIFPGLLHPSPLPDGRPFSLSSSTSINAPLFSTGLYPNIPHQHRPLPTPPPPINSGSYYQTIRIPQQAYYQGGFVSRLRVSSSERRFPMAALFFLFGWFCPPLWVLGACCCSGRRNPYEAWWGKANFVMAIMFIISSIAYSMIAVTLGDWMIGLRVFSLSTA